MRDTRLWRSDATAVGELHVPASFGSVQSALKADM